MKNLCVVCHKPINRSNIPQGTINQEHYNIVSPFLSRLIEDEVEMVGFNSP